MEVGVIAVEEVADFGLSAIHEVLGTAACLRSEIDPSAEPWTVTTIGLTDRVRTGLGHLAPTTPMAELSRLPDILMVPAVNSKEATALIKLVTDPQNKPMLELLRQAQFEQTEIAAACTGTFFLAEAGVLDGMKATTSWWVAPAFRRRYPRVDLQERLTLTRGHHITTAGAAFSHIDLALAVVRSQSSGLAELVDRNLLIGPKASQGAFVIPAVMASYDPLMAKFESWIRENLQQPIQVTVAAQTLGVSERTLQRTTASVLGMSPMDFVNEIRLDVATHLLRTTDMSASAVARAVGYLNVGTLRGLVHRRRGMTIRELRRPSEPY